MQSGEWDGTLFALCGRSGRLSGALTEAVQSPAMQRIGHIGMNCGCEYTALPRFRAGRGYSRLTHSIGVAQIVLDQTGDPVQAMAGLLHDVSTPCFAHTVDFLNGDHMTQESTEAGTRRCVEEDPVLRSVLARWGMRIEDVTDYHLYPVADNPAPGLCADRLEYTMGNAFRFGLADRKTMGEVYEAVCRVKTEDGREELGFRDERAAGQFARWSLACSEVYVSAEDRYAMQVLADILELALREGVLEQADLYRTEEQVIGRLDACRVTHAAWTWFCRLESVGESPLASGHPMERRVYAKRRWIDPWVEGRGRLSSLQADYAHALSVFLGRPQNLYLRGSGSCGDDGKTIFSGYTAG